MRPYEVMVIYDPGLDEQAIQAQVDSATQLIASRGGEPGHVERWGKRRLAYEIQHQRDGYYVLIEAKAEPATMSELGRSLLLADEVLRHKVIHLPDKIAGKPRSSAPPVDGEDALASTSAGPAGPARTSAGRAGPATTVASEAAGETNESANGA